MTTEELITQANRMINSNQLGVSLLPEALEFLRVYAGEKSSFYTQLSNTSMSWSDTHIKGYMQASVRGYVRFLENGLADGMSIERKAQIDVVSDFLAQANQLLETNGVHPAAPCVLIGASLEEFLRNWVEAEDISTGSSKPTLDSLSKALKNKDFLTKQDMKDIASWGGLRNHAAHGEWDQVSDKKRVSLMLEGVNLFMRKYGDK